MWKFLNLTNPFLLVLEPTPQLIKMLKFGPMFSVTKVYGCIFGLNKHPTGSDNQTGITGHVRGWKCFVHEYKSLSNQSCEWSFTVGSRDDQNSKRSKLTEKTQLNFDCVCFLNWMFPCLWNWLTTPITSVRFHHKLLSWNNWKVTTWATFLVSLFSSSSGFSSKTSS